MANLAMLSELFRHMEWADAQVWRSVLASPQVATDAVVRDRLFHVHLVQRAFLYIWRQRPPEFPERSSFPSVIAIASWGQQCHAEIAQWLGAIDEAALERPVTIPWAEHVADRFGQPAAPVTLAQTMLQVAWHSTHHRGQVNARLRELGGDPPLVDFLVWVWFGKPATNWPAVDADSRPVGV